MIIKLCAFQFEDLYSHSTDSKCPGHLIAGICPPGTVTMVNRYKCLKVYSQKFNLTILQNILVPPKDVFLCIPPCFCPGCNGGLPEPNFRRSRVR